MKNIPNNARFYFDHSFYTSVNEKKVEYGKTNYGNFFKVSMKEIIYLGLNLI